MTTKNQLENTWTHEILLAKRDEFWDTAPAYEGRKEIWQALKASVENITQKSPNYEMAQIIIDSAGIITPYGTFDCCYDELGAMYQIPVWVVSDPNETQTQDNQMTDQTNSDSITTENDNKLLSRIGSIRTSIKNKIMGNEETQKNYNK